ncbi:MAG: NfeD family protein [Acidithiobacillus sp.]|nr:NfeD family protein [Acidithiobacillus sp.]
MLYIYVIIAFVAGISELFTGTFYLAAVALAALFTAITGLVLPGAVLHWVFLGFCLVLLPAGMWLRHRLAGKSQGLTDFDLGQGVDVIRGPDQNEHYTVRYRGSEWMAVVDDGPAPCAGDRAVIVGKTDNLLHLGVLPRQPSDKESLCPPSSSS